MEDLGHRGLRGGGGWRSLGPWRFADSNGDLSDHQLRCMHISIPVPILETANYLISVQDSFQCFVITEAGQTVSSKIANSFYGWPRIAGVRG